MRREVVKLGYELITPPESPAPIASFLVNDLGKTAEKLRRARVDARVKWGQLRVSPSTFNTAEDFGRLLDALS